MRYDQTRFSLHLLPAKMSAFPGGEFWIARVCLIPPARRRHDSKPNLLSPLPPPTISLARSFFPPALGQYPVLANSSKDLARARCALSPPLRPTPPATLPFPAPPLLHRHRFVSDDCESTVSSLYIQLADVCLF